MKASTVAAVQLAARAAASAGLGVAITQVVAPKYAIYSVICSVLVTDVDVKQTQKLATRRVAGTLVGAATGFLVSLIAPSHAVAVGVAAGVAVLLSQLLGLRDAANIAGYIAGVLVLTQTDQAFALAAGRTVGSIIGVGSAVLVSFVPKLLRTESPSAPTT
jgi:uncharacterized membrane protein YgaE (UPF0421/DUF939 family)